MRARPAPVRRSGAAVRVAALLLLARPVAAHNFVAVQDSTNPIVAATVTGNYTGCAWVDIDGDGLLDLAISRKVPVYRNLGGGSFAAVLGTLVGSIQTMAMTWSDFDNDGDPDAFLGAPNVSPFPAGLWRNDGGFTFTKLTDGVLGDGAYLSGWGCSFADFDNDGYTDVAVAAADNFGGVNHPNRLLRNNGDGTFTDIDTTAVTDSLDAHTVGTWSDHDLDGDSDYFIGSGEVSHLSPDNLFRNVLAESGSWGFERIATAPIATDLQDGQVWNWIDYDNDGDLDAYLTNYNFLPNRLYRNDGGSYSGMTPAAVGDIVALLRGALASNWGDLDNDGDLDCIVTNDGSSPCDVFLNDGDGTFTRETSSDLATLAGPHYGASLGDYDRDGDLDLYLHGTTATKRLYRNDLPGTSHWVELTLAGTGAPGGSNASAIGARVRAKAVIGGSPVWQMREVSAQNSFNAMNMLDVHFGLGDAGVIDSLEIRWPAGGVQTFRDVPVDRVYRFAEGADPTGAPLAESSQAGIRLGLAVPNPLADRTTIAFELARPSRARLAVYDVGGRLVRLLLDAERAAGRHVAAWDARDDRGRSVGSGVYFVRLHVPGETVVPVRRVTVAR
jgi:hypothetical protein